MKTIKHKVDSYVDYTKRIHSAHYITEVISISDEDTTMEISGPGFYFCTECEADLLGPYDTLEEAKQERDKYYHKLYMTSEGIKEFTGEYFYLSNFYKSYFTLAETRWHTVEAAFQALKSKKANEILAISGMKDPADTKTAGRKVDLVDDWEDIKIGIMTMCVYEKFKQNPKLRHKLISTDTAYLEEGNDWNDTFWGVDKKTGEGRNELGKILMSVRRMFQAYELMESYQSILIDNNDGSWRASGLRGRHVQARRGLQIIWR